MDNDSKQIGMDSVTARHLSADESAVMENDTPEYRTLMEAAEYWAEYLRHGAIDSGG